MMRLEINNADSVSSIEVLEYEPKDYTQLMYIIDATFRNPFTVIYQSLSKSGDSYAIFGLHGGKLLAPSLELFDDALWKHGIEIKETK